MERDSNKTYCIVIPAYQEHLDTMSTIALQSLAERTNLYEHTYLVIPEGLNVDEYRKIFKNIKTKEFNKVYFTNIYTYTQLCISCNFYAMFAEYDYMLLYQLDCYLFRDEIQHFVNMGYDFIGAPIFTEKSTWKTVKKNKPAIGNGGLSLRRIKKFIELTHPQGAFRTSNRLSDKVLSSIIIEDKYFCDTIPRLYGVKLYRPTLDIALQFSWDQSVEYVDALLHNANLFKMPMGAHAINKYPDYWKQYIPEITDDVCNKIKNKQ